MKILKVDKDKAQVELTNKEFNEVMGTCSINVRGVAFTGSAVIIEFDMPSSQIVSLVDEIKCNAGEPMGIKFAD